MPRRSAYWKNPEKYRQEAREYSKKNYVPRKKKKVGKTTFGNINKNKSITTKRGKRYSNTEVNLDEIEQVLNKYYSKGYASKKLSKMRQLNQVFFCQGYAFMTISNYLKAYANKTFTTVSDSSRKGEQGLLGIIPFLQKAFPSPKYLVFLNPVDQKGIDVLVLKDGTPYTVIELTNYQKTSFLHSKEIQRYIDNLNYWNKFYPDIFKVMAVNHPENLKINPYWKSAYDAFVFDRIGIKVLR